MELPTFKYHPYPLGTGSIVLSEVVCRCCGQTRWYVYDGPVYAIEEYHRCICPWCIADGSAHEKLEVEFTSREGVGGNGAWDKVPPSVIEEVAFRTPGFYAWQQEQWWTHCGDAAQFLGCVGRNELERYGAEAVEAIRLSADHLDPDGWKWAFEGLSKDGSPTACLFRCSVCGKFGGYLDFD